MKTTKKILLVLLAAGALFFLSSCDAMLDGIFGTNNSLTVSVPVTKASHVNYAYATVTVYLYTVSGTLVNQITTGPTDVSSSLTYAYYDVKFDKLANGTYTLEAWYSGYAGDPSAYTYTFYDPNSGAPVTEITLPDPNPSDSTGKTVSVYTLAL